MTKEVERSHMTGASSSYELVLLTVCGQQRKGGAMGT